MAKALNDGLRAAMERDPKVLVMGEDVGKLGGVFRVTDGLQKDFGEQRVLDTPLAESGHHRHRRRASRSAASGRCARSSSTGSCSPASTRSSPSWPSCTSARRARCRCRWSCASRSAAASARSSTTASRRRRCSRTSPGSKVVACSNPVDAYWMIQQAIACDDPVIFFEPKRRYWEKAEVDPDAEPPPLFTSRVRAPGHHAHARRLRARAEDLPGGRHRRRGRRRTTSR